MNDTGNLKHLRMARDFMQCVPEKRLKLWDIGAYLTGIGFDQPSCDSVGCLGGWLQTMPEVREYAQAKGGYEGRTWFGFDVVAEWLGLVNSNSTGRAYVQGQIPHDMFATSMSKGKVPEKQEALNRLDYLIHEAEEAAHGHTL